MKTYYNPYLPELEANELVSLLWTTSGGDYQMGTAGGYRIVYSDLT